MNLEHKTFENPKRLNYLQRTKRSKKLGYIDKDYEKFFCIIGVGKLGGAIAELLLDHGFTVCGLDILPENKINPALTSRVGYKHFQVDFTNYDELSPIFQKHSFFYTFHTFIQNPSDVEVFHESLRSDCFRYGMMGTVHTYKNLKTSNGYEINHRKSKIDLESLENGGYARLKRQSEDLFKQRFGNDNFIFIPKCNHIVGANTLFETSTEIFNGYPLGISPPHFRSLTKRELEQSEIFLPNNGEYQYNIVDLLTLSEVIAGVMMSGNYYSKFLELNIGNPIRITAKDYYILAAKEFGIIKSESEINEFKQKFRNIDGKVTLEPESMARNWRLDLKKMLQLTRKLGYDNTKEFWENRLSDGIYKSSLVMPQEGEFIRQRMNLK
jgi:nucleoside-diphosphate-sugar epimerase